MNNNNGLMTAVNYVPVVVVYIDKGVLRTEFGWSVSLGSVEIALFF